VVSSAIGVRGGGCLRVRGGCERGIGSVCVRDSVTGGRRKREK
jgi:hypothetical protein